MKLNASNPGRKSPTVGRFGSMAVCETCGTTFQPVGKAKGRFCSRPCFRSTFTPVGTRKLDKDGYVLIRVSRDTPGKRVGGANKGWMREHRLVMQELLGRELRSGEEVHHKNGQRDDNRPENLELWVRSQPTGVRAEDYHCPGCQCDVPSDLRRMLRELA